MTCAGGFRALPLGVVLVSLVLAGEAARAAPPPGTRAFLDTVTRGGTVHQGASIAASAAGFHTLNVSFCAQYNYSSGHTYMFVYGTQQNYIYTDNPVNQIMLAPACVTGYLVGVDVIDNAGDWNNVYVYNHP